MRTPRTCRLALLVSALGVAFLLIVGQTAAAQDMSSTAKQKIAGQLQHANPTTIYQFDDGGALANTFKFSLKTMGKYENFGDLLAVNRDKVGTCKNPKPTPPEGCILCEDGRCLCTNYKFKNPDIN